MHRGDNNSKELRISLNLKILRALTTKTMATMI